MHRILEEQIDNIIGHCTTEQEDRHRSVHEIRKSCKRIRAVLRLIRKEIGYSSYYRENKYYRDLSRRLSEIRNFSVLLDCTRTLQADLSSTIPGSEFAPLIGNLVEKRDKMLEKLVIHEDILKGILKQLVAAKSRIRDLQFVHDDFRAFKGGLIHIYKQGRRYRDLSRQHPTSRNLHDLRKRIKYLWYQTLVLQPIQPAMLDAHAETLDQTGEKLGNYHDFDVLHRFLDLNPDILKESIHATLTDGCEIKKASLLNQTWDIVETLYGEKPKDMARRFTLYWNVYRNKDLNIIPSV